jgi:hypothetical protein
MKNKHDYSTILIWSAALVTVVRYAAAFIASDMGNITGWLSDLITFLMGFTGLGMGLLDVIGGTYLFQGWRQVMPKANQRWTFRFKVLTFFVFGLFISGILILTPFTISRITHTSMFSVLGDGFFLWSWGLLVNVIPYFLIGGVALGNVILTSNESETSQKVSENEGEKKENFPKDWRKLRPTLSDEDVKKVANLTSAQILELAKRHHVDARTVTNWRTYARKELGYSDAQ